MFLLFCLEPERNGQTTTLPPSSHTSNHKEEEEEAGSTVTEIPSVNPTPIANPELTAADYYFDSYSHISIHEEMLKDDVRTLAYMHAIEDNSHLFRGKVVLDVGCGTGILSMFCARAGAAQVYAIDCSSIISHTQGIIEDNGLQEDITLIQGKVEEVELPVDKVDIIVSEWMGYFLLYESMLSTVLFARDKWLKQGGLIFPDKAVLYLAAISETSLRQDKLTWWEQVYGFDMSSLSSLVLQEPFITTLQTSSLCSPPCPILRLDLQTCPSIPNILSSSSPNAPPNVMCFQSDCTFRLLKNEFITGFVGYFECVFSHCHKPIYISTGPHAPYTHWKQTIFHLEDVIVGCSGEEIQVKVTVHPNTQNERDLDIDMDIQFEGQCHQGRVHKRQLYRLR